MSPRVVARVEALLEAGRRQKAARSPSLLESAQEALRDRMRSPILRHAIAALRRGNHDAAFALLKEEVTANPEQPESTTLFWEVALMLERAPEAAVPLARLLRHEVGQGEVESAADHFAMLAESAPDTVVDVASIVRITQVLRTRLNAARGEEAQNTARALLCDALRRSVNPDGGALAPPQALRIVEEARGLELDVARRAARIALESSSLHEAKRARLEEMLEALEQGQWPADGDALTPEVAEAVARPAAPEAPAHPEPAAPKPAAKPAPAKPAARPAAPKPAAAKGAVAKPAAARPAAAKPAAAKPAPKPEAAAPRPPIIPAEEKGPTSGRKTVALTQDEIEAASTRLAERMAARQKAAAAALPDPAATPAAKPDARKAAAPKAPQKPSAPKKPAATEPEAVAEPAAAAPEPTPDPEATFIGVAARPAPAAEPEADEEVLGTITAEPFPDADGDAEFAIGGDLVEEESADSPLEVEPEDEDFALGITDMGPVLEVDEAEGAAAAEAASAAAVADADDAPDDDDVEFAIGIEDDEPDVASELTPELTPEPEEPALPEPDDAEAMIDIAFGITPDAELTPEDAISNPELIAEPEFAPDSEPELAVPIDDEKPEAEASPLAEAVSEALAPPASPALRAIDVTPVEIGADGLVAFELAQSQRTRIDYRAIEAVSVAEVAGLADEPVLLVYLVLRARPGRPRSALRVRCDAFDVAALYPDSNGGALQAMLADLLERTRAVPLPDPDSALGLRPQHFEKVADFEAAILARMAS